MIKNFIKITMRNIWKRKLFSFINIMGLTIGISCFFLIIVNVRDEFSYDNFHENKDLIYRVALERIYPDNVVFYAIIPYSIGEAMKNDIPEVEDMTRFFRIGQSVVFQYEDQTYEEDKLLFVEPNFFDMFSIPLLQGDSKTVLSTQNSILMTRDSTLKYFGDEDPIGKTLVTPQGEFLVSRVVDNVPKNSHIEFDFIVPLSITGIQNQPNYVSFSVYTYIKLNKSASPNDLETKMPALVEQYAAGQIQAQTGVSFKDYTAAGNGYNYFMQPIQDIHLQSSLTNEIKPNGNITYVYVQIGIAFFLIIIACINFMNLATAQSTSRAREVGIRKIVGSTRGSLIRQFLFESIVMSLLSLILAIVLIQLILPIFNQLTRKQLNLQNLLDPFNIFLFLAIGIFVGIFAGSYPAFVLSAFQPITVLKGKFATTRKGTFFRNALVVFQFTLSIILISMTILVFTQMNFIQNKDLGFQKDNVLVVERVFSLQTRSESFKQELLTIPGVSRASGSNTLVQGGFYAGDFFRSDRDPEVKTTRGMVIDQDFIKTMGLEILDGRGFSKEFNDDRNIVVNESTIREFGWTEPVGMKIRRMGAQDNPATGEYTIIGVVRDFHYESLHKDIDSFMFFCYPSEQQFYTNLNIKILPQNLGETLTAIEDKWSQFNPGQPFSYYFLDERLNELYNNEKTSGQIFNVFSILTIFIACVGLFGLSAYMATQRTKEIGIRKVLGSTGSKIVVLLSKDFSKLVLFAFIPAVHLSYLVMDKWLKSFVYRTNIGIGIFLLAGLGAMVVAQITVSFQAIKAANAHPADSIRSE
ncbi:MAG: ABC transporter permease [Candidatus Aminicenantes bacterium]|nr:ABC transporter permease [Candidatus Aminicenantes bacterium]